MFHLISELLAQDAEDALSSLETATTQTEGEKGEEEEEGGSGNKSGEFSADRKDLCPPGLATRIHRMVLQSLIPQLHKTLTEKVRWNGPSEAPFADPGRAVLNLGQSLCF